MVRSYIISGDEITLYLVFLNTHDGTGTIKAAMTPMRVMPAPDSFRACDEVLEQYFHLTR